VFGCVVNVVSPQSASGVTAHGSTGALLTPATSKETQQGHNTQGRITGGWAILLAAPFPPHLSITVKPTGLPNRVSVTRRNPSSDGSDSWVPPSAPSRYWRSVGKVWLEVHSMVVAYRRLAGWGNRRGPAATNTLSRPVKQGSRQGKQL
jgi:hypothetical protein